MNCPPPPERFNPAINVKSAKILDEKPAFIRRGRVRGRFALGMRYEREGQEWIDRTVAGRSEWTACHGPWLEFSDRSGKRWCQPDSVLFNERMRHCLIAEFKYQHTSDAWYQLKKLYLPVMQVILPGYTFALVEVVHYFDPATAWPERVERVATLEQLLSGSRETVATLIFNKRREQRILESRRSGGKGAGETDGEGRIA